MTTRWPRCGKCDQPGSYSEAHDSFYCAVCIKWLEPPCSDAGCEHCASRPDTPPHPTTGETMSTSIEKTEDREQITGTFRDPIAASARLKHASQNMHLISPATSVGQIPEGFGIALSTVHVDPQLDTYNVSGKRGLSKSILQRIGAAVGISWDFEASCRLDDTSDAYYCRWRAVGKYRSFDGQEHMLVGQKELDLRDGSVTASDMSEKQLREMRQHIQSHAETKAQLRAIRSLGIKTAYTNDELRKPFVCARVTFTGETDDPVLRARFAEMTASAFLGGSAALFGPPAQSTAAPRLPAPPPPVGQSADDPGPDAEDVIEQPIVVIPEGPNKGTPVDEASELDLQYWAGAGTQDVREACDAVLQHRAEGGALPGERY